VLARALWIVPMSHIPQPEHGESDASFFARLYCWKEHVGLPDEVFVRANVKDAMAVARHQHKPFYLDFRNPWLAKALVRILDETIDTVLFTEVLPNSEQLPLRWNGDPVVSEIQIEINWLEDKPNASA